MSHYRGIMKWALAQWFSLIKEIKWSLNERVGIKVALGSFFVPKDQLGPSVLNQAYGLPKVDL